MDAYDHSHGLGTFSDMGAVSLLLRRYTQASLGKGRMWKR
jgi:hypothetical protein